MDQSSRKYNGWRRMALAVVVSVLLGNHLWFPQSVAQAAGLAQSGTTGNAQCTQGMVALLSGRLIEARQTLSAGITQLQQTTVPNRQTLGLCALFLGIAHHSAYELNDARHAYGVAQQAFDQTTDEQMRWVATFALGNVAVLQGRFAETGRHLEAAQTLLDGSDDQGWTSPTLKSFAQVAMLNNWGLVISSGTAAGSADVSATQADARRYFSEALQRLRTLDERCEASETDCPANRDTALLSELLDPLARRLGLNESDKAMLLSLLQIAGVPNQLSAEDRQMLAIILPLLQIIDSGASAADLEAIFNAVLGGVIDSMIAPLATAFVPTLLNNIGETYRYEGQLTQARQFYEEGLDYLTAEPPTGASEGVGSLLALTNEGILYNNLALTYLAEADQPTARQQAIDLFQKALTMLAEKSGQSTAALNIHVNLGYLYQQEGQAEEALQAYEAAMALLETTRRTPEGDRLHTRSS